MSALYRPNFFEVKNGSTVEMAIDDAIGLASAESRSITFEFNGTHVVAFPGDNAKDVYARWNRTRDLIQRKKLRAVL